MKEEIEQKSKENIRRASIKVLIECDTTEIDKAIDKTKELNRVLERTIELKTKLNDDR